MPIPCSSSLHEGKTLPKAIKVPVASKKVTNTIEKITYDNLPEAEENETWELENGRSYDPNIFTKPQVSAKFFSKKVTFDIPMSFAERQVKTAFQNATQLNSFFSMIETAIGNSMTVKVDALAMRALNTQ